MRKHGMPEAHAAHPNVTPLIDVVMCLIIFFMLVAKIGVSTGADQKITIPATIRGAEIKDMGNTLTLTVQAGSPGMPFITALVKDEVRELKLVDRLTTRGALVAEELLLMIKPQEAKPAAGAMAAPRPAATPVPAGRKAPTPAV